MSKLIPGNTDKKRIVFESVKDVSRVLLLLVCLGASDVFGQARFGFTTDPFKTKSVYDEVENYQIEVANKLRRYFDQNKFMVIVDVEERERETQSSSPILEPIVVDTGLSVDYLPGLPFHPSIKKKSMEVSPKRALSSMMQKYFKHNIQVLMDTSYSQTALQFAEEVIRGSGLVNVKNGDEIFVEFQAFPNKYPNWETGESEGVMPVAEGNDEEKPLLNKIEELLDKKMGKPSEFEEKKDNESITLMWVIVGLVGLLLLFFIGSLIIGMLSRKKESNKISEGQKTAESVKVLELEGQISKLSKSIQNPIEKNLEIDELSDLAELKSFVTREFLSNNEKIADYLNSSMDDNNDEELDRIATIIVNVNKQLFKYLKPHLSAERHFRLKEELQSRKPFGPTEQLIALQSFRKSLNNYKPDVSLFKKKDIFQFLEQLNENQIIQLIKEESEDLIAILLAQLPPGKCMNVLSKFEFAKQTILLQRISGINDIPVTVYKQVSDHFSQKALTVQDMKNVAVDGLNTILKVLDTLPVFQQQLYLDDIAKYDIDLAKKIRNRFVTFDEIGTLDDTIVRKSMESVDPKIVALALIGAEAVIVEKILSTKPSREQMLIKSDMEFNGNASAEEIEKSRKFVIARLREVLQMQ
jgi:flagellar motor switch protein FliG